MKKYLKKLNYLLLIPFLFAYTSSAFSAEAVKYINTVYMVSLCEEGSTASECLKPVILGQTPSGTTMDIGGVAAGAAAASMGNTGELKIGTTYTYGQVILSRTFKVSGSDGSCQTSNELASGEKTTFAIGKSGTDTDELQSVMIPNGTGNGNAMNGSPNSDNNTANDSAAGVIAAADDNIKFRWELGTPFTPQAGRLPTMKIAFDLSSGLDFNGTCGGALGAQHGITPGSPIITNTFE